MPTKVNDKLIGLVMLAIVLRLAIGAVAFAMPGPTPEPPARNFGYRADPEASERFIERLRKERRETSTPETTQCAPTSTADLRRLAWAYVLYAFGGLAGVCAAVWMTYVACWLCDRDMGLRYPPPLWALVLSVGMSLLAAGSFFAARTL